MILGIDPSTKTGWCSYHNGEFVTGQQTFAKLSGMDRVRAFHLWIDNKLKVLNPEIIVMENYGFANAHSLVTLVEIGTAMRLVIWERHTPFYIVSPNALKKFVIGKGAGKKEEVMLATYKRWGFEARTNDEVDAYVLARIGMALIGVTHQDDLTIAQREVLAVVREGKI